MKARALPGFGMQGPNHMPSKTMTIMAAAVLFSPTIGHAQPSDGRGIYHRDDLKNARDDVRATRNVRDSSRSSSSSSSSSRAAPLPVVKVNEPKEAHNGVTGWTFAVLTMRKYATELTVKREPYGVFTSRDDCDIARAKKIDELDRGDYRQPHWLKDAPVISSTIAVGAKSITTVQPGGPTQMMNVTDCEAEKFSADSQMAQKN
jgi:hypothetical protein